MPLPVSAPQPAPASVRQIPGSRLRVLLRDYTILLGQQMYFWGRDVMHPSGNLLCEYGFEKRESTGLKGTSCYRRRLEGGGFIELHGACAGYYDPTHEGGENFLYMRNKKRCCLYSGAEPPAPGFYAQDALRNGPAADLYLASLRFLDWWLDYEQWIESETPPGWREKNYKAFSCLVGSRPSLPPAEVVAWLSQYRTDPRGVARVRELLRSLKA